MVGGNFEQGMIDLASEMGVSPEMFGVIDTLQMLREGGESEKQKIMQEIGSISVVSFPVVIQKLLSIPTPVGVESGGGGGSSGSGGLLSRWGFADFDDYDVCLLYTSPSPRDLSTSRMPSSA